MTPTVIPPIFLFDNGDAAVFQSTLEAAQWLESWAVMEGGITGFDSTGRKLLFSVSDQPAQGVLGTFLRARYEAVSIGPGSESDGAALEAHLASFLATVNRTTHQPVLDYSTWTLPALVARTLIALAS